MAMVFVTPAPNKCGTRISVCSFWKRRISRAASEKAGRPASLIKRTIRISSPFADNVGQVLAGAEMDFLIQFIAAHPPQAGAMLEYLPDHLALDFLIRGQLALDHGDIATGRKTDQVDEANLEGELAHGGDQRPGACADFLYGDQRGLSFFSSVSLA